MRFIVRLLLKEDDLLHHRSLSQAPKKHTKPTGFSASGPNQVWSWDVAYLPTKVLGLVYWLYLFEDIFSRKIVGCEVHERECGALASQLVQHCKLRQQCFRNAGPRVLHSDSGAPMKAQTMKAVLAHKYGHN